ncbi:MAG: YgfZ/GcvT domain-containing protein [Betaproteobacteria bacterium]
MNPNWQSFILSQGARLGADQSEVLDFGDATAELRATVNGTVVSPLFHFGLIECAGDEAQVFLHNQLTSDVNHLERDKAQHSAWCTAKGRMLASFIAWHQNQALRLTLAAELVAPVIKRLRMYVLRSKVTINDLTDSHVLIGLAGPEAGAVLATAGLPVPWEAMATAEAGEIKVVRIESGRFLIAIPAEAAADIWHKLTNTARPVGTSAWRYLDITAALPVVSAATSEEFVPQMADFEKIGGVSFHKGCYPGQEIVARTQYLGKVKRHLYRVESTVPLAAGDDLHSPENPDQTIGKIVTGAPSPRGGFAALAVIQSNFAASARLGAIDGPQITASAVNP